ncbi:MAG: nucleotide exchange factor GrpE [Sandaracinaceae bacterium]|nr:MAG: nucleotide exchange factor GrpE [Sandaracinaceae bacterium]
MVPGPGSETVVSDVDIKSPDEETGEEAEPNAKKPVATLPEDDAGEAQLSPMEELEAERAKLKDQLLRTAADFDNYRKRARKDVELAERKGKEAVLREILPVIDNLERAVAASADAVDVQAVRDGVNMVLKSFEESAARLGIERVESVGQRFDPNLHDAFQQVETDEHVPGTVVQEYQPGYKMGDKLLRPAMVVVARKVPEPKTEEGDAS